MLLFLLRLLVFDFVYSFLGGMVVTAVALPVAALEGLEKPGCMFHTVATGLGVVLYAGQGIIVAAGVVAALLMDPARWDLLWYAVGFVFSVPLALVATIGRPGQHRMSWIGIPISNAAYILACLFPQYIPEFLGDTAVFLFW